MLSRLMSDLSQATIYVWAAIRIRFGKFELTVDAGGGVPLAVLA